MYDYKPVVEYGPTCYCGRPLPPRRRRYCSYLCLRNAGQGLPYRLDPGRLESMWEEQGGRCALCDVTFDIEIRRPNVDHDHATGSVRGLLCASCNLKLGHFERHQRVAPERLARYDEFGARALAYLSRAETRVEETSGPYRIRMGYLQVAA